MRHTKRRSILAVTLIIGLILGIVPDLAIYAAEYHDVEATETFSTEESKVEDTLNNESDLQHQEIQEEDNLLDSIEQEHDLSESIGEGVGSTEVEEATQLEADISIGGIEYLYIESPIVQTPGTQRIVVSMTQEIKNADEIELQVFDENGNVENWPVSKQIGNTYLFEKNYQTNNFTGIYYVKTLIAKNHNDIIFLDITTIGTVAQFGVNKQYSGIEDLELVFGDDSGGKNASIDIEADVVTIGENGETKAQEDIVTALKTVSEEIEKTSVNTLSAVRALNDVESRGKNIVVALDPGHDANDAGAQANGLKEEVLTLKIANYCKQELEMYDGVSIYMTRTGAACPYNCKSAGECIKKRVEDASKAGAKIFVSFHLNAATPAANGAEVIVPNHSWKPNVGIESEKLAREILDELVALGIKERRIYSKNATDGDTYEDGSIADYFSVPYRCKEYGIPGIIIEHAFITNSSDVNNFLNSEVKLKKLGVADATGIAQYLKLKRNGWEYISGRGWKYYNKGSYVSNQWLLIGGVWYHFDKNGYMQTGWQYIDNYWYYMNGSGAMQTGWQYISGHWYYMNGSGAMQTGWLTIGTSKFYLGSNGAAYVGWHTIDGKKYYFNSNAYMLTGKQTIDGVAYEFSSDGHLIQEYHKPGWSNEDGKWYYYDSQGKMTTGWQRINGKWYYMDESGVMQTGWKYINQSWYYMNGSGAMQTGWQYISGHWYYMNGSGAMQTGWLTIGTSKFYLGSNGAAYVGWHTIDGKKYYFNSNAYMLTGKQTIDGKEYEFTEDGVLIENEINVGWKEINGKKYYYDENGKYVTGWKTINQKTYYFKNDGQMVTGWQRIGDKWYYFSELGEWIKNDPVEGTYLIQNKSKVTKEQLIHFYKKSGKVYPTEALKKAVHLI